MNAVAAIAVTLQKAQTEQFKQYAHQVLKNSKTLAKSLMDRQASLVTGGTDNHMMVVNTEESYGLDGRVAEETLDKASITTNKQIIPDDRIRRCVQAVSVSVHAGRHQPRYGRKGYGATG